MRNLEVPHSDITKQQLATYPMPPTHHSTQPDHCSAGAGSTGQSKQRTREKGREDRERDVERSPRPLGSSRGAHNYPSPNAAAPPSPGEAAEEALAPTRSYKVLMRYSHQVHRLRPLQLCTQNAVKTQPAAERVAAVCGGAIASGAAVCLACPAPTPGPSRGASPPALASTPPTPWSAGPGPLRPPKRWRGPRPP